MKKIAYLAMDIHARSCTLGQMDDDGAFRGNVHFTTSEKNIIDALKSIKAKNKFLTIEEGTLTRWVGQVAREVSMICGTLCLNQRISVSSVARKNGRI
jgi:hypothetical protein